MSAKRRRLRVTAKDIAKARKALANGRHRPRCCPIAQCLRRSMRLTEAQVFVGNESMEIATASGDSEEFKLTSAALRFIYAFDHDRPVKSFTFTVPL